MGVRRAVDMALGAADHPRYPIPIRTDGPLIHNRHVLEVLQTRGIEQLNREDDEPVGTVVLRAHGLSLREQEALAQRGAVVLDATCPHVRRVQETVRKYGSRGYMCVVVGDRGHAEVEGVLSFTGRSGHVVSGPEEVAALPDADRVVVVAQTTQDADLFRCTVEKVRARYPGCLVFDTICRSTGQRQEEVRRLAREVDAMIVVGSPNSANTRRLVEISAATGTPTFHVDDDRQLRVDEILGYERVGLTAGASTPSWMISKVVGRLQDGHARRAWPVRYVARLFVRGLINTNVWAAGSAAALTFANLQLLKATGSRAALSVAVAFFFVLSQHLLNQYGRRASLFLSEPDKADFFMANERSLLCLGVASAGLSLFLAAFLPGWYLLAFVAIGLLSGLLYRYRLPRRFGARLGF